LEVSFLRLVIRGHEGSRISGSH